LTRLENVLGMSIAFDNLQGFGLASFAESSFDPSPQTIALANDKELISRQFLWGSHTRRSQ